MRRIVFYSWQSDLPGAANRGFIQDALDKAASSIKADDAISIDPVIDRDTQKVPGSPDIAATIFGKISSADLFVADVSIVLGKAGQRRTPNPNVLIELGYALKALGPDRVIMVFNKAFGELGDLPFDLRMRRILTYEMPEKAERATERKRLTGQLEEALRSALSSLPTETVAPIPVIAAIEEKAANRRVLLRRTLDGLLNEFKGLEPKKYREGGTGETLIDAIGQTTGAVGQFSRICEIAAQMDDKEILADVYQWFGALLEQYDDPPGYSGPSTEADHDYFKFLGHELFVTAMAFLMKEGHWDRIGDLLAGLIRTKRHGRALAVDWDDVSQHLPLLMHESQKKGQVSLHADLLHGRHAAGGALETVLPLNDFMDADYFLFLLGTAIDEKVKSGRYWRAWSCLYMRNTPVFIVDAARKSTANQIRLVLGLPDNEAFKTLVADKGRELKQLFRGTFWRYPVAPDDIARIGSR